MEELICKLRSLLKEAVECGEECGVQLAIYQDGQLVADLAEGYRDPAHTLPVQPDTLFPVFSVGKGILSTAAHRLVQRGTLTYATRVADLWPGFQVNGKGDILFWHLLTHRAALHLLPFPKPVQLFANWNYMCKMCETMTPAWKPGTRHAYHGISFAWLVGHVLELADGRDIRQILSQEVMEPLQLQNDMFFGTTAEADCRIALIDDSDTPAGPLHQALRTPEVRHGCIPSFNGYMTARAIARHYAALADTTVTAPLLSQDTLANAAILRRQPDDQPSADAWAKHGLGYVCHGEPGKLGSIVGHGGALGAEGFLHRERHLALGFTRNKVTNAIPNLKLRDRISDLLGLPCRHW